MTSSEPNVVDLIAALSASETMAPRRCAFDICGRCLHLETDHPGVEDHFLKRLAPFVVQGRCEPTTGRVIAITSAALTQQFGLADIEEVERPDEGLIFRVPGTDCLAVISLSPRVVILAAITAEVDLYWFVDYLCEIIAGLMLGDSVTALHASALATPWGAMAFVAGPGNGKTTLATRCAQWEESTFLADDKLLVAAGEPGPCALPLYTDVHLATDTIELIPALRPAASGAALGHDITGLIPTRAPEDLRKLRLAASDLWPGWRPAATPVTTLFFPVLVPGRQISRIVPLSAASAWDLLSPQVLPFLGDHWPLVVERDRALLQKLLAQCSCWRIFMGRDLEATAARLRKIAASGRPR